MENDENHSKLGKIRILKENHPKNEDYGGISLKIEENEDFK